MAYPAPAPQPLSESQRAAILDQNLMRMCANGGARIESRMPTWAVVVTGQRVNTVAHLLATVFLCGLWLPFWIIAEMNGGETRKTISVDERGEVSGGSRRPRTQAGGAVSSALGGLPNNQLMLLILLLAFLGIVAISSIVNYINGAPQ